jgi:hypothetical protein
MCKTFYESFNSDSCYSHQNGQCHMCLQYLDVKDGVCTNNLRTIESSCGLGCNDCGANNECLGCIGPFYQLNTVTGSCYFDLIRLNSACGFGCKTCYGNTCSLCEPGLDLQGGKCTTYSLFNLNSSCGYGCSQCSGSTCSQCNTEWNFALNPNTQLCESTSVALNSDCGFGCADCFEDECKTCYPFFDLVAGSCQVSSKLHPYNTLGCAKMGIYFECLTCMSGFKKYSNGKCYMLQAKFHGN